MTALARFPIASLALATLLALTATAGAEEVSVTLSPATQDVIKGEAPRFEILVRANEHVRIAHRPDVTERLVKLRIAGPGELDDMPILFSEMGPVGDADYVVLERGDTMRFEYRGLPRKLGVLGPGVFTVYLRYRADFSSSIIESNRVKFRVVAPHSSPPAPGERR
jgi:hypothetical protein